MPILPGLAVVFVGIAGGGHGKVDQQVKQVVHKHHVAAKPLPDASVSTLARHKSGAKQLVQGLHAEGVVSFEVVGGHDLRMVIYDADGGMKTFLEFPISGGALASDDLSTLEESLEGDLATLRKEPAKAEPEPEPEPEIEMDVAPAPPPVAKAAPIAKPKAAPAKAAPATPLDDEMPAALGKSPAKAAPAPAPKQDDAPAAAPASGDASADAVSASDIEAMTSGPSETEVHAATTTTDAPVHIGAAFGFGLAGRSFSPGPSTIVGYSSTPVGMVHVDGYICPTARTRLEIVAEKTVSMSTPMDNVMAPTAMARWEALAGYKLVQGKVELSPEIGFGRRTFSIDSTDPSRTPDGEYDYLVAGAAAHIPLGHRLEIRGSALFEPVVAGAEPTAMALGDATRWAVAVGASVELHMTHVFARAGVDMQRFSWSWDMAGARGAGGAVDSYASGTLSVGANY